MDIFNLFEPYIVLVLMMFAICWPERKSRKGR